MTTSNTTESLTATELAQLERALVAERARLERFLPRDLDGAAAHAGDDVRLQAVVEALQRLRDGRYGTCARCGGTIPFGRLIVLPESDHCVRCGGI